jgi:hypothetical protein
MTLVDHPGNPKLFSGKLLVIEDELPKIIGLSWERAQFRANNNSGYADLHFDLIESPLSVVNINDNTEEEQESLELPDIVVSG